MYISLNKSLVSWGLRASSTPNVGYLVADVLCFYLNTVWSSQVISQLLFKIKKPRIGPNEIFVFKYRLRPCL